MKRRDLSIYAAAWLALVTLYSLALVASGLAIGASIRAAIAVLLPDAILGLALLRIPSFLRWREEKKGRFFAAHVGLLAAFIVFTTSAWFGLVAIELRLFGGNLPLRGYVRFVPFRLLIDVLIYCTVVGVGYARQNFEELLRAEALRDRAALEALRSQLNPHFILNTFHAIVGLVRREPAIAESALERLGDLLRYGLRVQRDGIDEVPLREECAFVESYLSLERLRLADRFRVNVDTPPATLEYLVPTFAVQILVENAIRHAISPRAAGGFLEIRAQEVDGHLRIAVKDAGAGEPVEARFEGSRMGLRLLQERLAVLYGADAKLTLRSVEGGTCADLEIPARRISEDA